MCVQKERRKRKKERRKKGRADGFNGEFSYSQEKIIPTQTFSENRGWGNTFYFILWNRIAITPKSNRYYRKRKLQIDISYAINENILNKKLVIPM